MRENADRFLILGGLIAVFGYALLYTIPLLAYFSFYRAGSSRDFRLSTLGFGLSTFDFRLLSFPLFWIAFEFLMAATEVSFPWLTVGNAFVNSLNKIQFIEYTGVYGVSFWALYISVLLFYLFIKLINKETFKVRLITVFIFIIFILPDIYSVSTSARSHYSKSLSDNFKIGIIQPNINPWRKWDPNQPSLTEDYCNLINQLVAKDSTVKLIVLPETAFPTYFLHQVNEEKHLPIRQISMRTGIPILTGFAGFVSYADTAKARPDSKRFSDGTRFDVFNSLVLVDGTVPKDNYQIYNKNKLVIGSERMAYQEKLPFLKDLISWSVGISSYQIGLDTTVFKFYSGREINFSGVICYESLYPDYFSKFVKKGAEFCVIVTNDGWWGKLQGTYQHNDYAVLRAVENRRWIARCANTGISGSIDPYGNKYDQTEINIKTAFVSEIGLRNEKTFYSEYGDLFGTAVFYSAIILFIAGIIITSYKKFKSK